MIYYNKVIVTGKLANDAETAPTKTGKPMSRFVLDAPTGFGEYKKTSHIKCTALGKTAELINQYGKAGKIICAEGTISSNEYKSKTTGNDVSIIEILIDKVTFDSGSSKEEQPRQATARPAQVPQTRKALPTRQEYYDEPQQDNKRPPENTEEQNNWDNDVPF